MAPLSTLPNWVREFQRWTPDIPVILYHGPPEEREAKRHAMMQLDPKLQSYPTVITSYEIVMRDRRALQVCGVILLPLLHGVIASNFPSLAFCPFNHLHTSLCHGSILWWTRAIG